MRKSRAVTGNVLRCGAALALFACTSPVYSPGSAPPDQGARDASRATDEPRGADALGRDATMPLPADAGGEAAAEAGALDPTTTTRSDAGASVTTLVSAPLPDAGVVTVSETTLPSWAPKLLGKYAIVIYGFSDDGLLRTSSRDLGIMEITAGQGGYEGLTRACQSYYTSAGGTTGAQVVNPVALPPRHYQIILGADTFVAKPIDVAVGYEQAPPPSCDGHLGELVDKRDFQTWITGSKCSCSEQAPPKVDDCRVIDADGDTRPGYTIAFRTLNATTDVYGVIESRSSFVQGHVADDGAHTAFFQVNDVAAQFGCDPAGCADVGGVASSCDTINSRVQFAALDRAAAPAGGWTCASIIDGFSTLFPSPAPAFPAHCKAQ